MSRSWIRTLHAVTALVLMVIFFAAAVAAAVGLVYLGFSTGAGTVSHLRSKAALFGLALAAGMMVAGLVIAWSLIPRLDRFVAPGPELLRHEHPALLKEIDRVAAMSGEKGPEHVYLVSDVNAFVAERGGLFGIGSKRVMGLGLPLLNALTVSELRAVLSHEFGHFAGGDTSLGRWIYKTRSALIRTLDNLAKTGDAASELGAFAIVFTVVHAPFRGFLSFYMRFTQALSRRQEFDADALAVRLEGTQALTDGLTKVHRAAVAYDAYMRGEVVPFVTRGLLPPLSAGFQQFLQADWVKNHVTRLMDQEREEVQPDPYTSHPPLHERIAAAERLNQPARSRDERLGVELLQNVPALESAVAQGWVDGEKTLVAIKWEESARSLEKQWRQSVNEVAKHFEGITFLTIGRELLELRTLAERVHGREKTANSSDEDVVAWAKENVSVALFVALLKQGYQAVNCPGKPIVFRQGEDEVEPGLMVRQYLDGDLFVSQWQAQLHALHVDQVELSTLVEA